MIIALSKIVWLVLRMKLKRDLPNAHHRAFESEPLITLIFFLLLTWTSCVVGRLEGSASDRSWLQLQTWRSVIAIAVVMEQKKNLNGFRKDAGTDFTSDAI